MTQTKEELIFLWKTKAKNISWARWCSMLEVENAKAAPDVALPESAALADIIPTEEKKKLHCIYCGYRASCKDHYMPIAWLGVKRTDSDKGTVPACWLCNSLLSDKVFASIEERADFLVNRYKVRCKPVPFRSQRIKNLISTSYGLPYEPIKALPKPRKLADCDWAPPLEDAA